MQDALKFGEEASPSVNYVQAEIYENLSIQTSFCVSLYKCRHQVKEEKEQGSSETNRWDMPRAVGMKWQRFSDFDKQLQ